MFDQIDALFKKIEEFYEIQTWAQLHFTLPKKKKNVGSNIKLLAQN